MASTRKTNGFAVGGSPRADLLPPEIKAGKLARAQRRGLLAIFILVVGLVAVGFVASGVYSAASQLALNAANERTGTLLAEKAGYIEVTQVNSQLRVAEAARLIGASTEVDWNAFLQALYVTMPEGAVIDVLSVAGSSPMEEFPQASSPLQPVRMAEIVITASMNDVSAVPGWLDKLATLPGYTDATPGSIALKTTGGYTVTVTMHIDDGALSNRFVDVEEATENE